MGFWIMFPEYFSSEEQIRSRPLRALIHRSSFKNNIKKVQELVGASEIIVVVKADAYGHGMTELAGSIGEYDLAVAIPEELHQLRSSGIKNRVWVLEGFFNRNFLEYTESVVWVLHSIWQLELLKNMQDENRLPCMDICLKLDTGMHRLGFSLEELSRVKQYVENTPQLRLYGLMSHFSMSDQADNIQVYSQINNFDEILQEKNWTTLKQSLANSGAICFYPESYRDWVRPGIMLYGGSPSYNTVLPVAIEAVMSFQSAIIALHHVKKGDGVGYGSAWLADKDSYVATVAVGYADGYPRHAPNGTPVAVIGSVSGQTEIVRLVGRVSMDMITIDVSNLHNVAIGDRVELWGKIISVGQIAELSGTIPYELLTSVSKRVPRVYED